MIIARRLAKIAGVPHLAQKERALPPSDPSALRARIELATITSPSLRRYRDPYAKRYAFDNVRYWQSLGRSLMDEAIERGELVNQIFDVDKVRKKLPEEPDILAVLYLLERIL
ncbi:MAG: hypothetical protein V2A76_04300 [Planctomycetota bacterium]